MIYFRLLPNQSIDNNLISALRIFEDASIAYENSTGKPFTPEMTLGEYCLFVKIMGPGKTIARKKQTEIICDLLGMMLMSHLPPEYDDHTLGETIGLMAYLRTVCKHPDLFVFNEGKIKWIGNSMDRFSEEQNKVRKIWTKTIKNIIADSKRYADRATKLASNDEHPAANLELQGVREYARSYLLNYFSHILKQPQN